MPIALRAVIFDYGNVLSAPQNAGEISAMSALFDIPFPDFVSAYWRYRLAYDQGNLEPAGYWEMVAGAIGRKTTPAQIEELLELDSASWLYPNPITVAWARSIREQGVRTGLISNLPVPLRDALETQCPWLPTFDHRTYSCSLRATKPDPRVYRHSVEGLGVQPSEALFLDDREENVAGAEAIGMHALLFKDAAEAIAEVRERFVLHRWN